MGRGCLPSESSEASGWDRRQREGDRRNKKPKPGARGGRRSHLSLQRVPDKEQNGSGSPDKVDNSQNHVAMPIPSAHLSFCADQTSPLLEHKIILPHLVCVSQPAPCILSPFLSFLCRFIYVIPSLFVVTSPNFTFFANFL